MKFWCNIYISIFHIETCLCDICTHVSSSVILLSGFGHISVCCKFPPISHCSISSVGVVMACAVQVYCTSQMSFLNTYGGTELVFTLLNCARSNEMQSHVWLSTPRPGLLCHVDKGWRRRCQPLKRDPATCALSESDGVKGPFKERCNLYFKLTNPHSSTFERGSDSRRNGRGGV